MLNELIERYPILSKEKETIYSVAQKLIECYKNGGKLMICGNGGSCADGEHIVGELMKGFLSKRPIPETQKKVMKDNCPEIPESYLDNLQMALPAIALPSFTALNSAFCNDVDPELMYAQILMGLARKGDILLGISTSGNSKNVYAAALTAKALGVTVIGLTGNGGGKLADISDICIKVPETETFKIQELHLPVYHYLCAAVEEEFFGI